MYQLKGSLIIRTTDHAFIPEDPANLDYQAYLAWQQGEEKVRARNELGQFVGDDPATPDVNEAWTSGST